VEATVLKEIQGGIEVSQVENLRRRQNRQNGRKPLECDQCGKYFSFISGNLKNRKRMQSGKNPFSATRVLKCFYQKGNLEEHERKHSGQKILNASSVVNVLAKLWFYRDIK